MDTPKDNEANMESEVASTSEGPEKEKFELEDLKDKIDNSVLLDPDHPLLTQFQKALKEYLQRQIAHLSGELYEIEDDVRRKEAEIMDVGVKAYEVQQQVCSQQKTLDKLVNQIETISKDQENEQTALEQNTKELKTLQAQLFQTEKTNRELSNEIESLTALTQQLAETEDKIENHITINKRIAERSRLENDQLAKEKRKQDYLIHQLMSDVWKFENELETGKLQIRLKENELEEIEQKLALGNTNIKALESELKALTCSWTSVMIAVSNRDKGLDCLMEELNKREERHKNILTEIGRIRKNLKKEQLENERFTAIKQRVQEDIDASKNQLEEKLKDKKQLETDIFEIQSNIFQMEKDIKVCQQETHLKQLSYNTILSDYKKLVTRKEKIEQEIFKCIQGEIANDAYGKKARKTLKDLAEKRRDVELILSEVENKKSMMYSDIESQKFKIEELNLINDETKAQMAELDETARKLKSEYEKFELLYRVKEKQVLKLNEKLEVKLALTDLDKLASAEMKIVDLTKLIEESQQSIKNLQVFWMREQKNILAVSKERQEQIHNISMLKKQVLILEQKNLTIHDNIEHLKRLEEKTQHKINVLTNQASLLCDTVNKKKSKRTSLDKNNAIIQGEYECKLKDAELELLQIEGEIADIEDEKLALSKELMEINREGLEWEKKFQMTKTAVNNLRENKKCGEAANMRVEIHKMEVIYEGLKKAQEKLLRDLQTTIVKREALVMQSEAKDKIENIKKKGERSRANFHKKLDDLRNEIQQTKNETDKMRKKYDKGTKTIEELKNDLEVMYKQPVFDKHYKGALRQSLEELKISRQLKFELLVFQQRKANMYSLIVANRTPYTIYKKDEELVKRYQKEKEINAKLIRITDQLKNDFYQHDNELTKIRNTLEIVALCMYK